MPAIRAAQRGSQSETALGEVETVADRATHAVILHPSHQRLVNAPLVEQVLQQSSYRIVGDGGDDGRVEAEATLQAAGHVVFAAAFGDFKAPRGPDATVTRIEPQHYFTQRDQIPASSALRLNGQRICFRPCAHALIPVLMSARCKRGASKWMINSAITYAEPARMNSGI